MFAEYKGNFLDNNFRLINTFLSVHEDLLNILEKNDEVTESVSNTQRLIDDYSQDIADRLKPKLQDLKREGDSKISLASEKCNVPYLIHTWLIK